MIKIEEIIDAECLKSILEYKGLILVEFDFPDEMQTGKVHLQMDPDFARKVAQYLVQAADSIEGAPNHTLN